MDLESRCCWVCWWAMTMPHVRWHQLLESDLHGCSLGPTERWAWGWLTAHRASRACGKIPRPTYHHQCGCCSSFHLQRWSPKQTWRLAVHGSHKNILKHDRSVVYGRKHLRNDLLNSERSNPQDEKNKKITKPYQATLYDRPLGDSHGPQRLESHLAEPWSSGWIHRATLRSHQESHNERCHSLAWTRCHQWRASPMR